MGTVGAQGVILQFVRASQTEMRQNREGKSADHAAVINDFLESLCTPTFLWLPAFM